MKDVSPRAIVSANIRLRYPDELQVGEGSIIDDYSYFSVRMVIGRYCHIASGVTIAGGRARTFTLGDFSGVSAGARVWCASDDFIRDLVTIVPPEVARFKENEIEGDVSFGRYTGIGSNSVVMPNNVVPEGTVIGALSFVPTAFRFEEWSVYSGIPIRRICPRDKRSVLREVEAIQRGLGKQA